MLAKTKDKSESSSIESNKEVNYKGEIFDSFNFWIGDQGIYSTENYLEDGLS